jgi:predicted transcriptional regulator
MKIKVGLSLEEITVKRVSAMATATRRDKSTIVDMAVELLAQQDEFQSLTIAPTTIKPSARGRAKARKFNPDKIAGVTRGVAEK